MLDKTLWRSSDVAAKKLAPVFKAMEWTWHDEEESPTENAIVCLFEKLEKDLKESTGSRASGRLVVTSLYNGVHLFGLESAHQPIPEEE